MAGIYELLSISSMMVNQLWAVSNLEWSMAIKFLFLIRLDWRKTGVLGLVGDMRSTSVNPVLCVIVEFIFSCLYLKVKTDTPPPPKSFQTQSNPTQITVGVVCFEDKLINFHLPHSSSYQRHRTKQFWSLGWVYSVVSSGRETWRQEETWQDRGTCPGPPRH